MSHAKQEIFKVAVKRIKAYRCDHCDALNEYPGCSGCRMPREAGEYTSLEACDCNIDGDEQSSSCEAEGCVKGWVRA